MTKVKVSPLRLIKLTELSDGWTGKEFDLLKSNFEVVDEGLSEPEQMEYLFLAMGELPPADLAKELLQMKCAEKLSQGQLENLALEMEQDRMWEEYPDMTMHQDIFNVNQLMYKVYNGKVSKGEAHQLDLEVETQDEEIQSLLLSGNSDLALRLIMRGMDAHGLINRLYNDEDLNSLIGDAESILWSVKGERQSAETIKIVVTSSSYWLEDFVKKETYLVTVDLDLYA